ncbi:tetratricopeptide repeat protein [Pseudomonas borbori]
MIKWFLPVLTASAVLSGCSTVPRGSIPVVDGGSSIYQQSEEGAGGYSTEPTQPQSLPEDSGVVVMVPQGAGSSAPIETFPAPSGTSGVMTSSEPINPGVYNSPAPTAPTGIPSGGGLAADEQLDGPVLALLSSAQQQQGAGDLNGAASSLERAQRIAPREPQVLYRLAEVRLAQGDAAQAEQFARRGLSYANGRPALQASLWNLIAQARERQGDAAGAAQAREQARVNL